MSPEFRLRPSLSVSRRTWTRPNRSGVAGVQTPAFVERFRASTFDAMHRPRVAGVQTPAFVERPHSCSPSLASPCVAGVQTPATLRSGGQCSVPHPCNEFAGLGADRGGVEGGGGQMRVAEHCGDGGKRHAGGHCRHPVGVAKGSVANSGLSR